MNRVFLVNKDDERASPGAFLNPDEALRLLRRAATEHDNLRHFRDVWRRVQMGGGPRPPGDGNVLRFLAVRLADGTLRVAGRKPETDPAKRGKHSGGAAPPPAPPTLDPPKPATPALKLRPPSLPDAPKLPDPITDFAKQADCLVAAAKDGLPFCEQCAKTP